MASAEAPIMSIYRESLAGLEAFPFGYISEENPAPIRPGMVTVTLEGRGRLREFRGAPYDAGSGAAADAPAILRAMSLDQSKFTETTATFTPMHASDRLRAWKGPHPVIPNMELVVEMGWWRDQVTHARLMYPYMLDQEDPQRRQRSWLWKLQRNVILFAAIVGIVFVVLLARRN